MGRVLLGGNVIVTLVKRSDPRDSEVQLWDAPSASCGEYRNELVGKIKIGQLCSKEILQEILAVSVAESLRRQ